jgi:S1-C subfamily serine protease
MTHKLSVCILAFGLATFSCAAQESVPDNPDSIPAAVQWTLDAAGPTQRTAIKSVLLLYCPKTNMKGTGFVLSDGLVVTNNHVVEGCSAEEMKANPFGSQAFGFVKMATDKDVDLALLHPDKHLTGGLQLAPDLDSRIGTSVNTWGFPLIYNGPAPLLSVGYIAGYVRDGEKGKEVKHIVVNGAFNPGNSGGPLFQGHDNKVIGVVVAKFHLYPPLVQQAIQALANARSGAVFKGTDQHGNPQDYVEGQVTAMVLDQFYKTTQVMIGEAISVSELRTFLKKKRAEVQ